MSLDQKRRNFATMFLARFMRKEDGILTIEAIIVFPLLIWSIWASYTFFDGYRQSARNVKAAYAVADIVSRERKDITTDYVDTLYGVLQFMVADRSDMSLRISYLIYDKPNDKHIVDWSCVRGAAYGKWTDEEIAKVKSRLPVMPNHGKMIIVETKDLYRRPYKIGFGDHEFTMDNYVFTHPRVFDKIEPVDKNNC